MSGTWPDGLPVHDLTLYVRLSCGHERVSRGWRGQDGDTYACDVCHVLTIMEEVSLTDDGPYPWRWAEGRGPDARAGEALFRTWRAALRIQGGEQVPWDDLSLAEQRAWDSLAEYVDRTRKR